MSSGLGSSGWAGVALFASMTFTSRRCGAGPATRRRPTHLGCIWLLAGPAAVRRRGFHPRRDLGLGPRLTALRHVDGLRERARPHHAGDLSAVEGSELGDRAFGQKASRLHFEASKSAGLMDIMHVAGVASQKRVQE